MLRPRLCQPSQRPPPPHRQPPHVDLIVHCCDDDDKYDKNYNNYYDHDENTDDEEGKNFWKRYVQLPRVNLVVVMMILTWQIHDALYPKTMLI